MPLASHIQKYAAAEARTVFALVKRQKETVESARELIAVPPDIEQALRRFADTNTDEQREIEHILAFRASVGEQFERLIAEAGTSAGYRGLQFVASAERAPSDCPSGHP